MGSITAEKIIDLALEMEASRCGLSIKDIEQKYEVSRSTAIRMKNMVEKIFPSLEEVPQENSRVKKWRLNKTVLAGMISFTSEEIAALEKCKSYMKGQRYTNSGELISEVITKINMLNEKKASKVDVEALLEAEGFATRQNPRHKINQENFNIITEALKAYRGLEIEYEKAKGRPHKIYVEPYGIIYGENTYLLAYNEYKDKAGYKLYSMHKINSVEIKDYFDKDESFNLKKYLSNAFGIYQETPFEIELLFSSDVKDTIRNYDIHPTQKMIHNEDGTTTVKLKAGGRYEICWFLFKWGKNVKIIAPELLKDTYKELLDNAMSQI